MGDLRLRVDGFYLSRKGEVIGPMVEAGSTNYPEHRFLPMGRMSSFREDGTYAVHVGEEHEFDLVAEYHGVLRGGGRYLRRDGKLTLGMVPYVSADGKRMWKDRTDPSSSWICYVGSESHASYKEAKVPGQCPGGYGWDYELTNEVLPDGRQVPLAPDFGTHDRVRDLQDRLLRREGMPGDAVTSPLDRVSVDVEGRYRVAWTTEEATLDEVGTLLHGHDGEEDTITTDHGRRYTRSDWEGSTPLVAVCSRVLPNGTEVPIGAPLAQLLEAQERDAALVPPAEDPREVEVELERARVAWEDLRAREDRRAVSSAEMSWGFVPRHWR